MRKVLKSHEEVCHVWANQGQSEGKCGNMFFQGTKIYSYGTHFLAGQIVTIKNKQVALVTTKKYSQTTAGHMCIVRAAVRDLMPMFEIPYIAEGADHPDNSKYIEREIDDTIKAIRKRSKVKDKAAISWEFETLRDRINMANEFFKLVGHKQYKLPVKIERELRDHLEKRLKRYKELNTPEMIAKRKALAARRVELENIKKLKFAEEQIAGFRAGTVYAIRHLPYDLLRIKDKDIETSGGAVVPIRQAKKAYKALKSGVDISGLKIGFYTVRSVVKLTNDTLLQIGCHKILLSEVESVLGVI